MSNELIDIIAGYINLQKIKMNVINEQRWSSASYFRQEQVKLINLMFNKIDPKLQKTAPYQYHINKIDKFMINNFDKPLDKLELYDLRDFKLKQIGI